MLMTSEHELALAAVSGIRCGRAFLAILVSPGRVFGNFGVEIDGHSRRGLFWLPLVGDFGVHRISEFSCQSNTYFRIF